MEKKIERVILSRPAVEAGEKLGFLPGDMKEKVDPYLRPLYDALYELFGADKIDKKIETGEIEIAPLAFMRGRTLKNCFAILDEAQNATETQIKMFLTRIGENSKLVVNGDPSQIDLINKPHSGLTKSKNILKHQRVRQRRAEAEVPAQACNRRIHRLLRPHRARPRLRPQQHDHPCAQCGRRFSSHRR